MAAWKDVVMSIFDTSFVKPWADPEIVQMHRRPMRSIHTTYPDIDTARTGDRAGSPWFVSLNGQWKIKRYEDVNEVPASISTNATRPLL